VFLQIIYSKTNPKKCKNMARPKNTERLADDSLLFNVAPIKVEPVSKETPLMTQYYQMKAQYPDAIMLFRVGDFYETFGEDAVKTANVLGITLTSRNNGGNDVPLAGFPYHSLDTYLPRLVRGGYRVAICEQLEKPSKEKKIVRRGVTEMVTPGIAISDNLLNHQQNNFLATVHFSNTNLVGVALVDLSTGEFLVSEGDVAYIDKLLQSFAPSEILFSKKFAKSFDQIFGDKWYTYGLEDWIFSHDYTQEKLYKHFEVNNLKGFGVDEMQQAQVAAGATLHYIASTEYKNLQHITNISRILPDKYVWLDRFTVRNLELLYSPHESGVPLIHILDKTVTPMGARLLKKWVALPLKNLQEIEARLDKVAYFTDHEDFKNVLETQLKLVGDMERLISKVPLGKVSPREVVQLKRALYAIEPVKIALQHSENAHLQRTAEQLQLCATIRDRIAKELVEDAPALVSKGGFVREGVNTELDELRHIIRNSKEILLEIQQREIRKTGIQSLKIGYNSVFGYYLEVTNKYKDALSIPADWVRKQTLSTGERYISEELKVLEGKILGAEEQILALEERIFADLVFAITDYIQPIQTNAQHLGVLDCLLSFSKIAVKNKYVRPVMDDSLVIDIKAGRHPVIEQFLPEDAPFIPNDIFLDNDEQQIYMITGPNMAGKSALLRQTALIALMAQMGSFVPAASARIGCIDKVFTRVGASDNLSSGESTFMVEMTETASILNNISERSLILLDEIGRGTSTYDGISIAWSIAEYLHNNDLARPKTLFATHYHELNELADRYSRIHNFHVATKEIGQKVIFLRKLVAGGSQHSFGIHVARMAGMPRTVVNRANEILAQLEDKHIDADGSELQHSLQKLSTVKTNVYEAADEAALRLKEIVQQLDLNTLTPIECMLKLHELKRLSE
jgi:DNA mismatch repair protein MutS